MVELSKGFVVNACISCKKTVRKLIISMQPRLLEVDRREIASAV